MRCMEDMHHADFMHIFHYAEYDKVVTDWTTAIAHTGKDEVAAKFVGRWEIGKRLIACLDAISQFCRGLRILEFMRDILVASRVK